jgi:hypothetical protein
VSFAPNLVELVTFDESALPPDLLLNGEPQRAAADMPVALYGSGWYPREPEARVRWASSPAELLIYSPQPQPATIVLQAANVYQPAGVGGTIFAALNDAEPQPYALEPWEPVVVSVALRAGWNTLHLEHSAGTFRPADSIPGSLDARLLSFEVLGVNVMTEQQNSAVQD